MWRYRVHVTKLICPDLRSVVSVHCLPSVWTEEHRVCGWKQMVSHSIWRDHTGLEKPWQDLSLSSNLGSWTWPGASSWRLAACLRCSVSQGAYSHFRWDGSWWYDWPAQAGYLVSSTLAQSRPLATSSHCERQSQINKQHPRTPRKPSLGGSTGPGWDVANAQAAVVGQGCSGI